jgi:predicted dehydrogenase
MNCVKLGVVGVGHLGQAHARILAGMPDVELVGVVDSDREQAETVASRCGTHAFGSHFDLFGRIDAACIVTPTTFHHPIACSFLSLGIPILVEKPLALNLNESNDLVELARQHQTTLQVGHIERFNPAYEELRSRPITPKFVEIERHGTFTGRSTDIGAVLDLMIHDLDLLLDLVGGPVTEVQAIGATAFGGHEDMVNARLRFESGCIAHLTASRMSPNPKRKLRVWAPEGYAGIDFVRKHLSLVQPSQELRQRHLDARQMPRGQRDQLKDQIFTRYLQTLELDCNRGDQLTSELEHFVNCVRTGMQPRVNGEAARDAIALAERVLHSIRTHRWDNSPDGPIGPNSLPEPRGLLFARSHETISEAA